MSVAARSSRPSTRWWPRRCSGSSRSRSGCTTHARRRQLRPAGDARTPIWSCEAAEICKALERQRARSRLCGRARTTSRAAATGRSIVHRVKARSTRDGEIVAWEQVIVGQSILTGTPFEAFMQERHRPDLGRGRRRPALCHSATCTSRCTTHEVGVPVLWWRSVGHTHTALRNRSLHRRVGAAAGKDPLELPPRAARRTTRAMPACSTGPPRRRAGARGCREGRARGIAVHESFNTYVAQIAEVSRSEDGLPTVHKVVVRGRLRRRRSTRTSSGRRWRAASASASARSCSARSTLGDGGQVVQSNFHDYRIAAHRRDAARSRSTIVPSTEAPTGVGEPGVPPIGPAVANAWRKLTGQRIHRLPFIREVA